MQNASGALSENGPHDRLPKMNALADPGKEHARILVIDDLPENTNLLKNFLQGVRRGYGL